MAAWLTSIKKMYTATGRANHVLMGANKFDDRMIELRTRTPVSGLVAYLIPVEELWDLV